MMGSFSEANWESYPEDGVEEEEVKEKDHKIVDTSAIEELAGENLALKARLSYLHQELVRAEEINIKLENDNSFLLQRIEKYKDHLGQVEKKLDDKYAVNEKIIEELEEDRIEARTKYKRIKKENRELRRQIEDMEQQRSQEQGDQIGDDGVLLGQIAALEQSLAMHRDITNILQAKNDKKLEEIEKLETELESAKTSIQKLENQNEKLASQMVNNNTERESVHLKLNLSEGVSREKEKLIQILNAQVEAEQKKQLTFRKILKQEVTKLSKQSSTAVNSSADSDGEDERSEESNQILGPDDELQMTIQTVRTNIDALKRQLMEQTENTYHGAKTEQKNSSTMTDDAENIEPPAQDNHLDAMTAENTVKNGKIRDGPPSGEESPVKQRKKEVKFSKVVCSEHDKEIIKNGAASPSDEQDERTPPDHRPLRECSSLPSVLRPKENLDEGNRARKHSQVANPKLGSQARKSGLQGMVRSTAFDMDDFSVAGIPHSNKVETGDAKTTTKMTSPTKMTLLERRQAFQKKNSIIQRNDLVSSLQKQLDMGSNLPFPGFTGDFLQTIGLCENGPDPSSLSQTELEKKFALLSIVLKEDRQTLGQRMREQAKARALLEKKTDTCLNHIKAAFSEMASKQDNREFAENFTKAAKHVEFLRQSCCRLSSVAEALGATSQERRVAHAIQVMIRHNEGLKVAQEREGKELEEIQASINSTQEKSGTPTPEKKRTISAIETSTQSGGMSPKRENLRSSFSRQSMEEVEKSICKLGDICEDSPEESRVVGDSEARGEDREESPHLEPEDGSAPLDCYRYRFSWLAEVGWTEMEHEDRIIWMRNVLSTTLAIAAFLVLFYTIVF